MTSVREPSWRAGDGVVVRTPLLPATTLLEWANSPDPRRFLADLIALPEIDEALFVASPSLYASIPNWREKPESAAGRRTEHSLVKYVARMAARSTPFGLFSGVSVGALGRQTKLELAPRSEYRRRTCLDNDYLFVLADELAKSPEGRARLVVRPNTSLYRIAGRFRYAAARVDGKDRRYDLAATEPTPYLEATLERAMAGATIAELAEPLVDDEITRDEALGYIEELVTAQILVSSLGIHVTGPETLVGMLAQVRAAGLEPAATVLERARVAIAALDAKGLGNSADGYRAIASELEPLPAKIELNRLFQVDMVKPGALTVSSRVAADVMQALTQLGRISRSEQDTLNDFRKAFTERWEDREIPLAEALDEESGIGFESSRGPGSEGAPLLRDLGFPGAPGVERVPLWPHHRYMLRKLADTLAAGGDEIVLTDADFDAMKRDRTARLPDAFSAMIRISATEEELARGEATVLCEGMFGPSGANLLGRFCHASPELETIVRAHLAAEEARVPDAIFAEVVHLNEGRIGNVICRPVLRTYEIPFLGVSGAQPEHQIPLSDLMVSVRGDRIVLRSRKLDKEIIPRNTTAHNFRLRSLCVYRFLCAVASQNTESVRWTWGALADAPYLPRVRYGRVLFDRATWNIEEPDLAAITKAVRDASKAKQPQTAPIAAAVAALRTAKKLPRFVALVAFDNELPIDLDNPLSVAAFADEISGAKRLQIQELFPAPDRLPVSGPEGRFANEVVLAFTRSDALPRPPKSDEQPRKRRGPSLYRPGLAPGSEWLYAKVYCGEATVDRVLREAVVPVVRDVHRGQWFFIRYQDPDPHLRVRFRGDPATLMSTVLPALEHEVGKLTAAGVTRKLVLDTYVPETDRYGGPKGIELAEHMFWHDSEAVLAIIELLEGDAGADARWRLALRGQDSMLEAIGLDAVQREKIVGDGREMLGREMNADTAFWGRIGDRFTRERASLEQLIARDPAQDAGHDLEPGFELLAQRDARIREVAEKLRALQAAGELNQTIPEMGWSLIHMHANRILHASHRAQELVLNDFQRRLHAARRARKPAAS